MVQSQVKRLYLCYLQVLTMHNGRYKFLLRPMQRAIEEGGSEDDVVRFYSEKVKSAKSLNGFLEQSARDLAASQGRSLKPRKH